MLAQINSVRGVIFVLMFALLLGGCTPAGPRAFLKGKKYLDRGDAPAAVLQFKRATTLLATNASAWNYYGVALQRAGQPEEAVTAYTTAQRLDHDLVEVHFNLGTLYLEQNRPDVAVSEFTAYTLRRPTDASAWLKLGFAQLKTGNTAQARTSFSTVLSLKGDEAEAYNGFGLASIQMGNPRDAAKFFAAALQARPDFAPALLNLGTVNQQYLHDSRAALENYQAYLALNPRPASYSDVKAIVASLTQSDVANTVMAPAVLVRTSPPPQEAHPKITIAATAPHPPPSRPESEEIPVTRPAPKPSTQTPEPVTSTVPTETVRVQPATPIVTTPRTNKPGPTATATSKPKPATNVVARKQPIEVPMPEEQPHHGFWHRLFNSDNPSSPKSYREDTSTPIQDTSEIAGTKPAEEKPAEPTPAPAPAPAPDVTFQRYAYTSPAKPTAGDRHSAEGSFTKARMAEQDQNWTDAEQNYQNAADADPSWFEAQYNAGVIAHRLHTYSVALPRYELALTIQPDSADARYNFALALKAAGYPADAADELKKIIAASPDEIRAHLALANLCAQSLHDVPQARQHYLKVLELQPNNPQAPDIRFWLSANSKQP